MRERGGEENLEQILHEAALENDTDSLDRLLEKDPMILRRVKVGCFDHTALHVAAFEGNLKFVEKLLEKNVALAGVLDSRRWSALHLAAARGNCDVVKALVQENPDMCLTLDGDGRNPLHLAAMKGYYRVLDEFFQANPHWIHELLKAKDAGGNTIFHLAIKNKKFEAMKFLIKKARDVMREKDIQKSDNPLNMINECGYTSLDILQEIKGDVHEYESVKELFRQADALKAKQVNQIEWLSKKQDVLMVVASLIATMAFQAGVSPPGGVWQDNLPANSTSPHRAGEAVMAYNYPDSYPLFLHANTIGFVASVSIILFLVTGLPFKKKLFMWIMVVIMWLTVTSMAFTYAFSITVITPKKDRGPLSNAISIGVIVWCGVMAVLLVAHTIRLLNRWLKENRHIDVWSLMKKLYKKLISPSSNQPLSTSPKGNESQAAPATGNGNPV
ncbi:ankyrin repeat-containing protein At5g02620-like [Diospyros lotus]|uniref:ankyrin repeat-containing protein At5g02620-like n=1 Tax=Diospyros lotus TaxID=55363 RepID=UPI00225A17C4|nr:ankyrin repeat-containing protein At5g02620-like [Diospyros lotus]